MQEQRNILYRVSVNDQEHYIDLTTAEAERGIVRIDKPIDEDIYRQISGFINNWIDKRAGEPFYIIINSPGGHVSDGLAILDSIEGAKAMGCDVYTIATGMAASMGAFLLASGSKGCRYCTPNAQVLLHQPLGGTSGQATDMMIAVDNIIKLKERLNKHLADFTGQSVEELAPKLERDYVMTPEQALKEGVIDAIDYEVNILGRTK